MTGASSSALTKDPAFLTPANLWPASLLIGGVALHAAFTFVIPTVMPGAIAEIGGVSLYAWATTLFMIGSMLGSAATGVFLARFGARGAFQIGLGLFAVGMLSGAMASSMAMIISARLLQGLGGGVITAVAFAMVPVLFPPGLHPRAIAMLSVVWAPSALVGPLLGGVLADVGAWRVSFHGGLLLSVIMALAANKALPGQHVETDQSAAADHTPAIPGWRLTMITIAALAISVGSVQGLWFEAVAGLLVALVSLVMALRMDARAKRSLLPEFRFNLNRIGGVILVAMFLFVFNLGAQPFLPYILGVGYRVPLILAGPIAAGSAIFWALGAVLSTRLSRNGGVSIALVAGPLLAMIGVAGTSYALLVGSIVGVGMAWALFGLGIGIVWPYLSSRLIAAARPEERQLASMSIAMIQLAGMAFGSAYAGLVANFAGFVDAQGTAQLAQAGGWLFALCMLPTALAFLAILRLIVLTDRFSGTSQFQPKEDRS